jgi:hypothetical protein
MKPVVNRARPRGQRTRIPTFGGHVRAAADALRAGAVEAISQGARPCPVGFES